MTLSLPMLLLLLACGLGLYLYGIALVWRRDRLTAVFALLLPPLGLFALAKYWGERANNPRWYLLGGLVLLALAGGLFGWHVLATQQREEADWLRSHDADEARRVASARARRARALTSLVRSQGKVEIAGAATGITVPQHFRFIDRSELERAFAGTSDAPAGIMAATTPAARPSRSARAVASSAARSASATVAIRFIVPPAIAS